MFIAILIPQVAFAAWWNPFSWGWVKKIFQRSNDNASRQEVVIQEEAGQNVSELEALKEKVAELEKKVEDNSDKNTETPKPSVSQQPKIVTSAVLPQTTNTSITLTNGEIVNRLRSSVVYISTDRGSGSGFFIDSYGLVLTNAHVVINTSSIRVSPSNGDIVGASLVGIDEYRDIALLRTSVEKSLPVKLGSSSLLKAGDDTLLFGYPFGISGDVSFKEGTLSRKINIDGIKYLETSADAHHGNSGGPLVNAKAEVVGILARRSDETDELGALRYAIEIDFAKPIIENLKQGMFLVKNKESSAAEVEMKDDLDRLYSKISGSVEISNAETSAYDYSLISYYKSKLLSQQDSTTLKSYADTVSKGLKTSILAIESLKSGAKDLNDLLVTNGTSGIYGDFQLKKLSELDSFSLKKISEYNKKYLEVNNKISELNSATLSVVYLNQQSEHLKSLITYIGSQQDELLNILWIKNLF